MARICEICNKKIQYGNQVSHSKRHTKRTWLPNIQKTTITLNGKKRQINICTRCLRTYHKLST